MVVRVLKIRNPQIIYYEGELLVWLIRENESGPRVIVEFVSDRIAPSQVMRKGTNQMAGTPKARHPTPSPGLGSIFSCPFTRGEAESTAGYFYLLHLLLLGYTKVFLLQAWVHGGPLCTVKNVNRKAN